MPEYAIETAALRREFGRNVAVAGLSLAVPRGEVFGFLGPNGAGKTTSLKLLLGLVAPTSGGGTVLGAPLGNTEVRKRISFLPEHFRFHDCLNARELLHFHGRLLGLPKRGLDTLIETLLLRVGLEDAAHRPLRTYSKGMTQRAGLAQAIMGSPELVFLDEPTSGLDPLGRLLVRDVIDELRSNGASVFLNSHLLGEVEATCDRVAFVKNGLVVHELELASAAGTLDVELRVGHIDDALLEGLAAFGTGVTREEALVRMHAASESMLPELARWLVGRGVALYELRCRRKTLEEWFVEVMGEDQRPG
ncbi:MAG TPA: ABC transporter ATP-binding protein [Gammaproteobacteria bacterium]